MAAYAMCSRQAAYGINSTLAPPTVEKDVFPITDETDKFKKPHKGPKWKPFNLNDLAEEPPAEFTDWANPFGNAVPDIADAQPTPKPRKRKPRRERNLPEGIRGGGEAAEGGTTNPNNLTFQPLDNFQPPKGPRKRRTRKKMAQHAPNSSEYVPPHLRNRSATPAANPGPAVQQPSPPDADFHTPGKEAEELVRNGRPARKPRTSNYVPPYLRKTTPATNVQVIACDSPHQPSDWHVETKEPEPEPPVWQGWAAEGQYSSEPQNGRELAIRPKALPSPPASVPEPDVVEKRHNGNKPRWPHAPKPGRKAWPKNRDMKPQLDNGGSDGGVRCNGWEDDIQAPSDPDDPNHDIKKLVDWNGNWLPGDVEWDIRKPYTNRHFTTYIDGWLTGIEKAYGVVYADGKIKADQNFGFVNIKAPPYVGSWEEGGEIAIRAWIPTTIDAESPQQFWKSYPFRAPAPVDDDDLEEAKPWWELYPDDDSCQLPKWNVPDFALDYTDFENRQPNVTRTTNEKIRHREQARDQRVRRIQERRNRPSSPIPAKMIAPDTRLKPLANINIRPVVPADAWQIAKIYNHYVKHSVSANEFTERTQSHMTNRIVGIMNAGLPWIVAVQKGNTDEFHDEIVGYACIDDYCDVGSMYRFTFELEIFVSQNYLCQGVGKCLMDQMLSLVHPGYIGKGGYEWLCRGDYLKNGCGRVVKVLTVSYPHINESDPAKTGDLQRMTTFLKMFGFRKAGHLHGVGYKNDKCVDLSTFQLTTTEPINAAAVPANPL